MSRLFRESSHILTLLRSRATVTRPVKKTKEKNNQVRCLSILAISSRRFFQCPVKPRLTRHISSVQHSASHVAVDTRLLTAMMASTSVSNDNPSGSLPSTLSSHPESTPRSPSLETLLFYHQDVVVPVPAGMVPLPPLPSDERPIKPERSMASSQQHRFYLSFVSTLPGLSFMPWNMWRPRIESHRGFPKPYRPDFRAPDNREQALKWWSDRLKNSTDRESPVRVLPPPPRPPVTVDGPHWWVVYVGRVPGIYDNA